MRLGLKHVLVFEPWKPQANTLGSAHSKSQLAIINPDVDGVHLDEHLSLDPQIFIQMVDLWESVWVHSRA